jgi:succinate dehydrogenase/fumarate reductase flavoprotein subunit
MTMGTKHHSGDYLKSGKGPVYMDCRGITDEDYAYMMEAFVHEGLTSLINHLKEEGVDLRKHPIEFGTYHIYPEAKIWITEKGETSLRGLYAAGDESIVSIGPAATYGWLAGASAAGFAKTADARDVETCRPQIDQKKAMVKNAGRGPNWQEPILLAAECRITPGSCGPTRSSRPASVMRRLNEGGPA